MDDSCSFSTLFVVNAFWVAPQCISLTNIRTDFYGNYVDENTTITYHPFQLNT